MAKTTNAIAAIYNAITAYEKSSRCKHVATNDNFDTFVANYENLTSTMTGSEKSTLSATAKRSLPIDPKSLLKNEKRILGKLRREFEAILKDTPLTIVESESAKYIREWFNEYLEYDRLMGIKTDNVDMKQLCEDRSAIIIDALPVDFRKRYAPGAILHAEYEILCTACVYSEIGRPEKAKDILADITGSIVKFGQTHANLENHHIGIMRMFLFCMLETLPVDDLKIILPTGNGNIDKDAKRRHNDVITALYSIKEAFATRQDRFNYVEIQVVGDSDEKTLKKRNPKDFKFVRPAHLYLTERGFETFIVNEDDSVTTRSNEGVNNTNPKKPKKQDDVKTFTDNDRGIINDMLDSDSISDTQKEAIRKILTSMDGYHDKYQRLRSSILKSLDDANTDLQGKKT